MENNSYGWVESSDIEKNFEEKIGIFNWQVIEGLLVKPRIL